MTKYKHTMDTLDGVIEWKPPSTEAEKEIERKKLHPDTSIASYLKFQCHYCDNQFYLEEPIRCPGLNPLRSGYILTIAPKENDKNRKLIPTCKDCLLELSGRNETINLFNRFSSKEEKENKKGKS